MKFITLLFCLHDLAIQVAFTTFNKITLNTV